MGNCDNECWCYLVGSLGLEVTDTGASVSPYDIHPEAGRWVGMSITTAAGLPALTAGEAGTMALVADTGLVYRWTGSAWQAVGPEWRQTFPGAISVNAAANVDVASSKGITLTPGWWKLSANGFLQGTIDAPTSSGVSRIDWNYTSVRARLGDSAAGEYYDTTWMTASGLTVTFDGGVVSGYLPPINEPFSLIDIMEVPAAQTRFVRVFGARDVDSVPMTLSLQSIDIEAVRVAPHDFTN